MADKARSIQDVRPDTPISFEADVEDLEDVDLAGVAAAPAVGIDEDISMEIMETTAAPDVLKLWPWVNQVCRASHCPRILANRLVADAAYSLPPTSS